jgi:hypothetical protein
MYSPYDYTVHSQASRPPQEPQEEEASRHRHHHRPQRVDERRKRRADSPDLTIHRKSYQNRRQRRHSQRDGDDLPDPAATAFINEPYFYHHPAANLGSGNYHTISHFNFYRRPSPAFHYCAPECYPQQIRLVPPPSFDYARTLGRRRRESPMAMIPPPPPPTVHTVSVAAPQAFELKPLSLKKLRNRSPSSRKSERAGENYKMYTWSPYSSSLFYAERMAEPRSMAAAAAAAASLVDYPYQLREPFLGKKRIEELRF